MDRLAEAENIIASMIIYIARRGHRGISADEALVLAQARKFLTSMEGLTVDENELRWISWDNEVTTEQVKEHAEKLLGCTIELSDVKDTGVGRHSAQFTRQK